MKRIIVSSVKRSLVILLALFMLISMFPIAALATVAESPLKSETVPILRPLSANRGQNYRNLGLTPGGNVEEMRFTWHSGSPTGRIRITNPNVSGWYLEIASTATPLVAHEGTEFMGSVANLQPGRPGYTYFVHHVTANGLTPETTYNYVVIWDNGQSEPKTFRTGGSDTFSFLIAGDPQIGVGNQALELDGEGWLHTLEVALAAYPHAEFLMPVGDQIHTQNTNVAASQARHDLMFGPAQLQELPILPVVGNHDGSGLGNTNSRLWPMHYNLPDTADNVLRFNDNFYTQLDHWTRWGNVLFIVLDSNTRTWVNSVEGQNRLAFMEDAIAANDDAEWLIVAFHHPPYSVYRVTTDSAKVQIINNWIPEFERLGVDAVFSGHCHVFNRTHQMLENVPLRDQQWLNAAGEIREDSTGVRYNAVLDPTGILYIAFNSASGSGYYNVTQMPRNYIAAYNQNFRRNFSAVTVTPNTFEIATYQVNDNGTYTLMDVYTIVRSNGGIVPAGYIFRQLEGDVLERITAPADVTGVPHGTEATAEGLGLPATVGLETHLRNNVGGNIATIRNAGGPYGTNVRTLRAPITWNITASDYDPAYTGSQAFTVTGTVGQLPREVVNSNNISLTTTIDVQVFAYGEGPPPLPPTIPIAEANAAEVGTPVLVAGYVTAIERNDRIMIQDSTEPWGGIFVIATESVEHYLGQWVVVEGTRGIQWSQPSISTATVTAHPDEALVPLTPVLLTMDDLDNSIASQWNSMLISFEADITTRAEGAGMDIHNIAGENSSMTMTAALPTGFGVGDRIRVDRALVHWRADLEENRLHTNWEIGGVVRAYDAPLTVAEANMRPAGTLVTVRGIATNYYEQNVGERPSFHFQDYDARTPLSGMLVRGPIGIAADEVIGSEIIVTGIRNGDQTGSAFARTENITLEGAGDIEILAQNVPQPTPVLVPSLLSLRYGAYSSMLIALEGVQLTTTLSITGPGGLRPNFLLYPPEGAYPYTFAVACGTEGWTLPEGVGGGDFITINRAAPHFWQGRHEIQIRLLDYNTDVSIYVPTFTDVAGHWAVEEIQFVFERGLMRGTGRTTFEPDSSMSRAMLAAILYRLEGEPEVAFRPIFGDVAAGQWYSEAVIWAYDAGIVQGFAGNFNPTLSISRQEFATMIYRYADYTGVDTTISEDFDPTRFTDLSDVDGWATEGMLWSIYNGLFTGETATTLNPQGNTTRAAGAAVLMRYILAFATS